MEDVGEDDLGVGGDAARREELLDLVIAFPLYPHVDGPLRPLGILISENRRN